MSNKSEWPELEGKNVEEARKAILSDNSDLNVIVVPVGDPVIYDYNTGRVRVFVDR